MSGLSLTVDLSASGVPGIDELARGLETRQGLHERIGERVRNLVRDHFLEMEGARHTTAERLGAKPSGFWGMAANNTSSSADEDGAVVSVNHPGVGRADHDVTIEPGQGKQWLTLPLIAQAYNQRAYRVPGLFVVMGAAMPLLVQKRGDDGITPWYALVRSVTQPQDRTILPSDEGLNTAALAGVRDYVDQLLAAKEVA